MFRKEYRELSEQEKNYVLQIKEKADELAAVILESRQETVSKPESMVKLEECVMWAVKEITG